MTMSPRIKPVPLTTALAIELCPFYGTPASDELKAAYGEAMQEIRRLNAQLWACGSFCRGSVLLPLC